MKNQFIGDLISPFFEKNLRKFVFSLLILVIICLQSLIFIYTVYAGEPSPHALTGERAAQYARDVAARDIDQQLAAERGAYAMLPGLMALWVTRGSGVSIPSWLSGVKKGMGVGAALKALELWLRQEAREYCPGGCGQLFPPESTESTPESYDIAHRWPCRNPIHGGVHYWWECITDECPHTSEHKFACYGPCDILFETETAAKTSHIVDCFEEPCVSFENPEDNNYYNCPDYSQPCPNHDNHWVVCAGHCGKKGPKEYKWTFSGKQLVTIKAHYVKCTVVIDYRRRRCNTWYYNCHPDYDNGVRYACPNRNNHIY